jgi:biopolymer transport protein ExbD
MSMNNKQDPDEIVADINMTPLIDVMLVLLIIFMVTSSAAIESGLDINLPEASSVTSKEKSNLIVSLNQQGLVAVAGKIVDKAQLRESITKALAELKTDSVVLEGDGASSLNSAFEIMEIAKNAGAKEISIAAKQKSN